MTDVTIIENRPLKLRQSAETKNLVKMIADACRDPAVDVAKARELMALHREALAWEAERAFNEAMMVCQSQLPRIFRNKKSESGKYADLEAVDIETRPIIAQCGFSESYGTDESKLPNHYGITCLVGHIGGFTRLYRADVPTDMLGPKGAAVKTAIHGFGSATTYGRRYLKCMIFNIVLTNTPGFVDDDGRAAGRAIEVEYATPEQMRELHAVMDEKGIEVEKVLAVARVESMTDLTKTQVPALLAKMRMKTGG